MTIKLPGARAALVDNAGVMTPQFYRFFSALEKLQDGNASDADIAAINAQLAALQAEIDALPEAADRPTLQATYPILSQGLLQNGFANLALDQPGDTGTGSLLAFVKDAWGRVTGTKAATITGTAGRITVANGDASAGLPTIDLATVADAGGGSLLRLARDAWGRITGTSTPSTTDLAEGSNLYYTDARADARITLQKGQPSGVATLDSGGKLDAGQLPALAITDTFVVSTQAAMLALSAQQGDVCVRTDLSDSFILTTNDPTTLSNWQELETPVDGVASFNGRTGSVTPASGDYTFAQIASKPTTLVGYGITDAVQSINHAQALDWNNNYLGCPAYTVDGTNQNYLARVDWTTSNFATAAQGVKADNSVQIGNVPVVINAPTGSYRGWLMQSSGSNRWQVGLDPSDNYFVSGIGAFGIVLTIDRVTGAVNFSGSMTVNGDLSLLAADGSTSNRQPRVFVQSSDPGSTASDNDLWAWSGGLKRRSSGTWVVV